MPVASIAVAESVAAATDAVLADASVLAVVVPTEQARVASASVVAPIDGRRTKGAGHRRVDGIAVVAGTTLTDALRVADELPDPVRIVVVPQSAYKATGAAAASAAAALFGRCLIVVPVRKGGAGLVEAVNEYGAVPTATVLLAPGDAGLPVDEEPSAAPPEPTP